MAIAKEYPVITGGGDVSYTKPTASGGKTAVTESISSFNKNRGVAVSSGGNYNPKTTAAAPTNLVYKGGPATPNTLPYTGGKPTSVDLYGGSGAGSTYSAPTVRKTVPYDTASGGYGIRASFENSGLDASKLGYDGQYVTYNGIKLKPTANVNGTTYASQKDINDFLFRSYRSDGRNLVQANQYINGYGMNGVGWNSATRQVTVNGKPIDYAYIDENGNAWVDEDIIRNAYDEAARNSGIMSQRGLFDAYIKMMNENDSRRDEILNERWSYTAEDMERDAAYQAYKEMYERQAAKAYKDQLGYLAGKNGGGLSSAAQLAASAAYNEQMQMLSDRIPELQQMAYNRWIDDRNARLNGIAAKESNAYNQYAVGADSTRSALEREDALRAAALQRMYEPINLQNARSEATQNAFNAAYQSGTMRGEWTDDEAMILGLKRKPDGTWPKPWEVEIDYNNALWKYVEQPQMIWQYAQEMAAADNDTQNNIKLLQYQKELEGEEDW